MNRNTTKWKLNDWERECGGGTAPTPALIYTIFDEIAQQALEKELAWWEKTKLPRTTLFEWRDRGIPGKNNIMIMISILRRVASKHRQVWLSDDTIAIDIDRFLGSLACRNGSEHFLTTGEIEEICQLVPVNQRIDSFFPLYRRLFPSPPKVLHGRNNAIKTVKKSIEDNIVTVITALPGQGKTSLAWHVAVDLIIDGMYMDFDWTTHKYTQLDTRTGEKKETNSVRFHNVDSQESTLYFDDVLISMTHRFNWVDARAMSPLDRENKCAELMASRRYLIVLDNIETFPDIQAAVEYFSRLKGYGLAHFNSRILITSRREVYGDNIRLIDLEGIDKEGVHAFFADLALDLSYIRWQNLQQIEVWEVCKGNPLLMMIVFYRFSLGHRFDELIRNIKEMSGGFETVFHNMFSEFISELNQSYVLLARVAAVTNERGIAISFADLQTAWIEHIYPAHAAILNGTPQDTLNHAIQELSKYRILTPLGGREYAMHPLIRAYLSR